MGGSNAVSRLQLPSSEVKEGDGEEDSNEFDANVTVRSDECLRTDSGVRFQYLSIEEKEKKKEEVRKRKEEKLKKKIKFRIRKFQDTSTSLKHRLKKPSSGIEEIVSSHKGHDPLKWFGVLVPGTLRQSQSHFSRAVEQSVECANLHNEIQGVLARQKYLRRMKAKIEKEMQD